MRLYIESMKVIVISDASQSMKVEENKTIYEIDDNIFSIVIL